MGLFDRKKHPDQAPGAAGPAELPDPGDTLISDDAVQQPLTAPLGQQERDTIDGALEQLQADGVDVDALTSLGVGLDAAYQAWARTREGDHSVIIDRYSVGIGEHLARHTDLEWRIVTDVFGTDLAVIDGPKGSFVVVPSNLVAGRWMRGETGWIPAVVGHLVRRRRR